jgi:hypothetical protein
MEQTTGKGRRRPIFGPATSWFVGRRSLRTCSLLTPRFRPKPLAAPSAIIGEMTSNFASAFAQKLWRDKARCRYRLGGAQATKYSGQEVLRRVGEVEASGMTREVPSPHRSFRRRATRYGATSPPSLKSSFRLRLPASGFAGQLRRDKTTGKAGRRRTGVSDVVGKVGDGWGSFARGTRGRGAMPYVTLILTGCWQKGQKVNHHE